MRRVTMRAELWPSDVLRRLGGDRDPPRARGRVFLPLGPSLAYRQSMRFLHPEHDEALELSLEDVFLVPGYFDGSSRLDVDLRPVDFPGGAHPVVSANMNAVTGKRMAETMARLGGLGVLPQDMDLETAARIVKHIKSADPRYDTPLSVSPRATLRDVLGIIRKRAHDMVIVVDDERRPLGIVTHADLRDRDQYSPVGSFMASRLVTIPVGTPNRDAFLLMEDQRVKAAPVVDAEGRLVGVLTRDDAVRLELLEPALDARGKLMVAAAVGISAGAAASAARLAELGVAAIVLDTAHGHQRRMIEAIREVRRAIGPAAARGRERLHARGHPRPPRRGRGHREGERRAGRHVHDPHADRRRPADVLVGARVRPRGPRARAPRLGRRRRARSRATWRSTSPPARRAS